MMAASPDTSNTDFLAAVCNGWMRAGIDYQQIFGEMRNDRDPPLVRPRCTKGQSPWTGRVSPVIDRRMLDSALPPSGE
jgi:hypothetical protein